MIIREVTIDAHNQSLGRIASRVAATLRGKYEPTFDPTRVPPIKVKVLNARHIRFTGKKLARKHFYRFSGYPGGLKRIALNELFQRSPEKILYQAIARMLPANRLRRRLLRRLTVIP